MKKLGTILLSDTVKNEKKRKKLLSSTNSQMGLRWTVAIFIVHRLYTDYRLLYEILYL